MHQECEYLGPVRCSDLVKFNFAALDRAYAWWAHRLDNIAGAEPAFAAALAANGPTIHLKLDTDRITLRSTLGAIRQAAPHHQGA